MDDCSAKIFKKSFDALVFIQCADMPLTIIISQISDDAFNDAADAAIGKVVHYVQDSDWGHE
jgi:hypothetical protein